jgi:hypothetical protein
MSFNATTIISFDAATIMTLDDTTAPLEFALRVVLASACVIHSILDITDPFTGAKSSVLQASGSIPSWLLPAVGLLRAVAAVALFSDNQNVVFGALAYCSMLWSGAAYFHVRCEHHPAAPVPAILFVLLVALVTALRVNLWFSFVGTMVCAVAAAGLGRILVTPPKQEKEAPYLLIPNV